MLRSTNPELDDDDDKWKFVPYIGAALLFFSWIVQSGLAARKRKAARFKFEPNALGSIGSVNGREDSRLRTDLSLPVPVRQRSTNLPRRSQ